MMSLIGRTVTIIFLVGFARTIWAEPLIPVPTEGGWTFITPDGEVAIDRSFDGAGYFVEGRAAVRLKEGWGYIDRTGTVVIEPQFIYANPFRDGVARVGTGDSLFDRDYQFIDRHGQVWGEHLPVSSRGRVQDFSEGILSIHVESTNYLVNRQGSIIARLEERFLAERFSEGVAGAMQKSDHGGPYWMFIKTDGAKAIDARFDRALPFSEGLAPVRLDGKWIFINRAGEQVIDHGFDRAYPFSEGFARVRREERGRHAYGYVDTAGFVRIDFQFSEADDFSEGLAAVAVREDGVLRWGYIDHGGGWVIPPAYRRARAFRHGVAAVHNADGTEEYVNRNGDVVWPVPD